ncbi:LysE family translocator [Prosthecochloris marina]|uniref:LysE family translocator n=1 Tax=Prosthecochloris marina TaxID=2017681 RepID=UPI0019587620|nr:LysE family translocator [Prosthecochloris marina]
MNELFPPLPVLVIFTSCSLILAITPGPGVLYIVTRSLTQGRHAGLAPVGGVALGNLGNAIGASVGLATLFAVSSIAFTIVKYCGALYLIYLGVRTLRSPRSTVHARALSSTPARRIFRDGFFVALLNPKTAIFFGAFLPQFMASGAAPILQTVTLGSLFVAICGNNRCNLCPCRRNAISDDYPHPEREHAQPLPCRLHLYRTRHRNRIDRFTRREIAGSITHKTTASLCSSAIKEKAR